MRIYVCGAYSPNQSVAHTITDGNAGNRTLQTSQHYLYHAVYINPESTHI